MLDYLGKVLRTNPDFVRKLRLIAVSIQLLFQEFDRVVGLLMHIINYYPYAIYLTSSQICGYSENDDEVANTNRRGEGNAHSHASSRGNSHDRQ